MRYTRRDDLAQPVFGGPVYYVRNLVYHVPEGGALKRRCEMNTMNLPGFTAENSIYTTNSHFQSEADRSLGSGQNDSHVYMQKPRKESTAGGKCHATSSSGTATVNTGTYNSEGDCCGPKFSNGSQLCINCDNGTCSDGDAPQRGIFDRFRFTDFQRGVFARF